MTGPVLVTGGFGLVGSATVKTTGRPTAATSSRADLDTPANVKKAKKLPSGAEVRWADLTDPRPGAAPGLRGRADRDHPLGRDHRARDLPHCRNWRDGSTSMRPPPWSGIAEAQPTPPRFVQASSNAVFGPRNPHRTPAAADRRRPDAAMRPLQRHQGRGRRDRPRRRIWSGWCCGFGGVLTTDSSAMPLSGDAHALRERAAERQPRADRRRPRRRVGMRRCDDGRRRRARSC